MNSLDPTTTHPAVAEYVARIQAALADLPASEVEEIVEDIRQHLSEVAGEQGGDDDVSVETLAERLGTPEQYASELRAAAGYPSAEPVRAARGGRFVARIALWSLILGTALVFLTGLASTPRLVGGSSAGLIVLFGPLLALALILIFAGATTVAAVADLPESRRFASTGRRMAAALPDRVAGFLRSLRPGWWLLRIALLVGALLLAFRDTIDDGFGVLPLLMLFVLLWFGPKASSDRRWRWIVNPANAFTIGLGLALLGWVSSHADGVGYVSNTNFVPHGGVYVDGRSVDNVYVFGPDGKPIPEVYLYDQEGRPITMWPNRCDGPSVPTNKFPQLRVRYDANGCHEVTDVPFTVAIPQPNPAPSTTIPPPSK